MQALLRTTLGLMCLAMLAAAQTMPSPAAEGSADLTRALTECLLTPEALAAADYTEIKCVCSSAITEAERCQECPCALLDSLLTTLEGLGFNIDTSAISVADATVAIQNCMDLLIPSLAAQGIDLQVLLGLASCPTPSTCLTAVTGV